MSDPHQVLPAAAAVFQSCSGACPPLPAPARRGRSASRHPWPYHRSRPSATSRAPPLPSTQGRPRSGQHVLLWIYAGTCPLKLHTSAICRCVSDTELCVVEIDVSSFEDWSRRLSTMRSAYLLLLSAVRCSLYRKISMYKLPKLP